MSSCTGKSQALSAPAKAPSFGSSISRPITSHTPSFTPSRRTGPSSSRWESMKNREQVVAAAWGPAPAVPVGPEAASLLVCGTSCGASSPSGGPSAPGVLIWSFGFFNSVFLLCV